MRREKEQSLFIFFTPNETLSPTMCSRATSEPDGNKRKIHDHFLSHQHIFSAALYAHSRRHMEDDSKANGTASLCEDIAKQLIESETGKRMNVILGGGLRGFLPKRINETHTRGRRLDERNLTDEWISLHDDGDFVTNKKELEETTANHVLGLFSLSHLRFRFDQNGDVQPSLSEMTTKAIKLLKMNNENGFLLVVESAKIDLAHHLNNAFRALDETLELERAVEQALGLVGELEESCEPEVEHDRF